MKGQVYEIFSSIQGEGLFVGVRQIFVRFSRCNLNCAYCDTPDALDGCSDQGHLETIPGSGNFINFANPVSSEQLMSMIEDLHPLIHHSLSLTGGEPLVQVNFLRDFLPLFNHLCPVFLETNGTLGPALDKLLPYIDLISMDIKLPSIMKAELWEEHKDFLRRARRKKVYVKVVLTGETTEEEIDITVRLIKDIDLNIPLILQPVTPRGTIKAMAPGRIIALQDRCCLSLHDVRVIPQMHQMIGQL